MFRRSRRHGFLLLILQLAIVGAIAMLAGGLHAEDPASGYAGAWRLDDRNSDGADAMRKRLQEAGRGAVPAPASSAPGPAQSTDNAHGGPGGHRGGGMGRMGGGGTANGGMRGGHGGKGERGGDASKSDDKAEDFRGDYPLPPTLEHDNVLLVQQDAQSIQVRFANGQSMDVVLDGQRRQSLAGTAMISGRRGSDGVHLSIQYADGSQLDERWVLAPDGKQLTVLGDWKLPSLAQAVSFRRSYVGLP
jgi:hypothetical protein